MTAHDDQLKVQLAKRRDELAEAGEELADIDQHDADSASELYEKERIESRIGDLERQTGHDTRVYRETDPDDTATPLDEPEAPEPIDAIPMAAGDGAAEIGGSDDPYQEADIDGPGLVYPSEGGAPAVGEPEPSDRLLDERYRPDD